MRRIPVNELKKGMTIISISSHPVVGIVTHIGGSRKRKEPLLISVTKLDGKHTCLDSNDVAIYDTSHRDLIPVPRNPIRKSRRRKKQNIIIRKSRRRKNGQLNSAF
jgi:hypothetical protein